MRVMGVDQSFTKTGIVIMEEPDGIEYKPDDDYELQMIYSYVFKTDKNRDVQSISEDRGLRGYEIVWFLSQLAEKWEVDHINIEGVSLRAHGTATHDLAGLCAVLVFQLQQNEQYELQIIPPTALKKYGAGVGFAKKIDMIKALPQEVLDRFQNQGFKRTTGLEDLADAYFLANIYWRE